MSQSGSRDHVAPDSRGSRARSPQEIQHSSCVRVGWYPMESYFVSRGARENQCIHESYAKISKSGLNRSIRAVVATWTAIRDPGEKQHPSELERSQVMDRNVALLKPGRSHEAGASQLNGCGGLSCTIIIYDLFKIFPTLFQPFQLSGICAPHRASDILSNSSV